MPAQQHPILKKHNIHMLCRSATCKKTHLHRRTPANDHIKATRCAQERTQHLRESGRTQRGHHASLAAAGRSPRQERIGRSESVVARAKMIGGRSAMLLGSFLLVETPVSTVAESSFVDILSGENGERLRRWQAPTALSTSSQAKTEHRGRNSRKAAGPQAKNHMPSERSLLRSEVHREEWLRPPVVGRTRPAAILLALRY